MSLIAQPRAHKSDYDATLVATTRRGSKRRTMKKSVWGVATFAALALSLSACGADPAATEPEPAEAEGEAAPEVESDGSEIIIGGRLCLNGILSPLYDPIMLGAELAIDELNDDGGVLGKEVKFVSLDGKSDPVTVGNNGEQLVDM